MNVEDVKFIIEGLLVALITIAAGFVVCVIDAGWPWGNKAKLAPEHIPFPPATLPRVVIGCIKAMQVKSGDTVILECMGHPTFEQIESVKKNFKAHLPDGVRIAVMYGGMTLKTVIQST